MKRLIAIVAVVLAAAGLLWWRLDHAGGVERSRRARPEVPNVVVGTVERRDVPVHFVGIGTVQAYNSVAVRSRVDGQLVALGFREGQEVHRGDVLARIDPRPFEATLLQDEAARRKSQAQLANARQDLQRFETLAKRQFATAQSLDAQRATVRQLEAQVAADEAQIQYARTQLDYCTITSPIDGRTGIRQVDVGNIVHAADSTPMVTVTQLHPISVIFTLPADDLPAVSRAQAAGALPADAVAKDGASPIAGGRLDLFDNQIDQTSGTIRLKATFPNQDSALWPGQFVNVRLLVETRRNALTVAANAVQTGPNGPYVWVLGQDRTVQMHPVTPGPTVDGRTVVAEGLAESDTVVVDGQYGLKPGIRVAPAPPADGAAPSGKPDAAPARRSDGEADSSRERSDRRHRAGERRPDPA